MGNIVIHLLNSQTVIMVRSEIPCLTVRRELFFTMSVWWWKRGLYCCWGREAGLRFHDKVTLFSRYDSELLVLNDKAQSNGNKCNT